MNKGKIVQIIGPVVDVEFSADKLPAIYNALTVEFTSPGAAGKTKLTSKCSSTSATTGCAPSP
jgi:F0F1-type ATP synthase beta subunit